MHEDNEIVLITCSGGYFGQGLKVWDSMNLTILKEEFMKLGYSCQEYTFEEVVKNIQKFKNRTIYYSSTQKPDYKDYLEDVLLLLKKNGNRVLPSFDMFRAHENKGYQELLRRYHEIEKPEGIYLSGGSDLELSDLKYPVVFKTTSGAQSTGVKLMHSVDDIRSFLRSKEKLTFVDSVKRTLKRILTRDDKSEKWYQHKTPKYRFVLQEFIPGLKHDYKTLVFKDRIYAFKRLTRDNDFRASGSYKFDFVEVKNELLDFAYTVFEKFNEPYLSLDIAEYKGMFYLIEFQGIHFGPVGIQKSQFYYEKKESSWEKILGESILEEQIANAIVQQITKLGS